MQDATSIVPSSQSVVQQWQAPEWDAARIALAKKMVTPPGCSDVEFDFYITWCKKTGLDPFMRQAFLIERGSYDSNNKWVVKFEPMASEAGMAARVDMQPDYLGMQAGAVYVGDEFAITDGVVHHSWSLESREKNGNKLLGGWAHARRAGRAIQPTYLPLSSRIQKKKDGSPTKFWLTMPDGQIIKCARAEQYRLAYPNVFGGVYIRDEMPESEERDVTPSRSTPPPAAAPAKALPAPKVEMTPLEKIVDAVTKAIPGAKVEKTTKARMPIVDEGTGEVVNAPKASPPPPAPAAPAVKPPSGYALPSGAFRGRVISTLSNEELNVTVVEYQDALVSAKSPKAAESINWFLNALQSEQSVRGEDVPF